LIFQTVGNTGYHKTKRIFLYRFRCRENDNSTAITKDWIGQDIYRRPDSSPSVLVTDRRLGQTRSREPRIPARVSCPEPTRPFLFLCLSLCRNMNPMEEKLQSTDEGLRTCASEGVRAVSERSAHVKSVIENTCGRKAIAMAFLKNDCPSLYHQSYTATRATRIFLSFFFQSNQRSLSYTPSRS